MPQSKSTTANGESSARTVVSLPAEIVTLLDARIKRDGGEALAKLGVGPETLRTGYVHKILNETLGETES